MTPAGCQAGMTTTILLENISVPSNAHWLSSAWYTNPSGNHMSVFNINLSHFDEGNSF